MTVVALLPAPAALLVGVDDGWGAAHDRWTYLLAGTLLATAGVLTVRRWRPSQESPKACPAVLST
ncbi:hypothetical protein GAR06_00516 [Micromonospora saelicesensis]|uniref:LPXTG cell wall anchor domain-containing protein n=1 Tax=Micromonospora saelicesensis TaxID=285676 RepID=A0ABX9CGR8_9ACTN|nr:hypothetical protein GAR05_03556 [Micromonospora saelicesensis]RAO50019.1 hypothetical protein GAR06_00516 [Micromonospora saelicesensis]RAO62577.1 hypothetical protein PSN01_01044 [Micromonospora saelicesensis]